jgi:hypothetical protein
MPRDLGDREETGFWGGVFLVAFLVLVAAAALTLFRR